MSAARERLIDAGLRLVAERGIGGVTMSAVIEEAGVARQTLYNHFSDVESIVVAVLEEHSFASLAQLKEMLATAETAIEQLEVLVRHSVAMGNHEQGGYGFGSGLSAVALEKVTEHDRQVAELIEQILVTGHGEGVFRTEIGVGVAARLVMGVLDGAEKAAAEPTSDPPTLVKATLRLLLHGLGQPLTQLAPDAAWRAVERCKAKRPEVVGDAEQPTR